MTECTNHNPVWVESARTFECSRCGALIHSASGRCGRCWNYLDEHDFFATRADGTPDHSRPLDIPVCKRNQAR